MLAMIDIRLAVDRAACCSRDADLLLDWVPDAAHRQTILVENPRQLYGFD
jgi:predicted TIM-barrel fold metal-dependent hydrolase